MIIIILLILLYNNKSDLPQYFNEWILFLLNVLFLVNYKSFYPNKYYINPIDFNVVKDIYMNQDNNLHCGEGNEQYFTYNQYNKDNIYADSYPLEYFKKEHNEYISNNNFIKARCNSQSTNNCNIRRTKNILFNDIKTEENRLNQREEFHRDINKSRLNQRKEFYGDINKSRLNQREEFHEGINKSRLNQREEFHEDINKSRLNQRKEFHGDINKNRLNRREEFYEDINKSRLNQKEKFNKDINKNKIINNKGFKENKLNKYNQKAYSDVEFNKVNISEDRNNLNDQKNDKSSYLKNIQSVSESDSSVKREPYLSIDKYILSDKIDHTTKSQKNKLNACNKKTDENLILSEINTLDNDNHARVSENMQSNEKVKFFNNKEIIKRKNLIPQIIQDKHHGSNVSIMLKGIGIITGQVIWSFNDITVVKLKNNITVFINNNFITGFF